MFKDILMEWEGGGGFTKEQVEGGRSEPYLDFSFRSTYGQFESNVLGNGFQSSKVVLVAIN